MKTKNQVQNILIIKDNGVVKHICLHCGNLAMEAAGRDYTDGYFIDRTYLAGDNNVKYIMHQDCQQVLYAVVEE